MSNVRLFTLDGARRRDPAVDGWIESRSAPFRPIVRRWFDAMRACGPDVVELLHDGHPTACVGNLAFGYVNAFSGHVNVGFFDGANLRDPAGMLEGTGRFMRHVKIRPDFPIDEAALRGLIVAAYGGMKQNLPRRPAGESP
jgi:hypothetical protein